MENKEKVYKKPLGQLKIEKFCSDNNNLIQNYISHLYKNNKYKIKLMTNADDSTNRYKHCGAHICVETPASNDYYYITTSRKDYYCQNFLTINENLLELIKQSTFNYKILLFNNNKIYRFDKWVFDDIEKNESHFVNVPLTEAEDVYTFSNDDFRTPKKYIRIKWEKLGYVRYSEKFDMHKTKCCLIYDHSSRLLEDGRETNSIHISEVFSTVKDLYDFLNKCKVLSKPVSKRAFYKYLKRGFVETNINGVKEKIYLATEKAARQPQFTDCYPEAVAHRALSILVDNNKTTNIDSAQQVVQQTKDNTRKYGGQRRLDKQLDNIADKLVEKETVKYTSAQIQKTVVSFGSNKNMLSAYMDSLTEKGLHKEAEYAAKIFDALNNIDFD